MFGETLTRSGSTATPVQFAGTSGYQADATTGLLLLGHRYYDASIGRFLSSDPAQAGSNWYAYCDNNPLVRVDPTGLDAWTKFLQEVREFNTPETSGGMFNSVFGGIASVGGNLEYVSDPGPRGFTGANIVGGVMSPALGVTSGVGLVAGGIPMLGGGAVAVGIGTVAIVGGVVVIGVGIVVGIVGVGHLMNWW